MSKPNKRQRATHRMIAEKNELMACLTGGELQISRRGVPHVVVGVPWSTRSASVCWFQGTKTFRVFAPHPSRGERQVKRTFADADDAARCALRIVELGLDVWALRVAEGREEPAAAPKEKAR